MLRRDPALVVRLSSTRHGWPISAHNSHLIGRVNFLRATRRALGALATFTSASFLREQCRDPGVVDKVEGAEEDGEEEQVEEDAGRDIRSRGQTLENNDSWKVLPRVADRGAHYKM